MRRIVFLVVLSLLVIAPINGQSPNGTVSGIVVDASGAVIVGAEIVVANDATGVQYLTKTNAEGMYLVPNLPPGTYRLQVSEIGFKTIIKPDIVIHVQDALAINFTLPIGAASEVVTVEGGTSMINTTSAAVSTVVDQTYVKNMPLNGRSFQDLILLTPGIVTQTPQNTGFSALGSSGEFSVNGQRTESNYYTVDGVSANVGAAGAGRMINVNGASGPSGSVSAASALGTTQALVSVDELQEFRVQSSSYSAEYGRNPGGQFAFETKSGTNQWHGTAFEYLRNGFFDARDWFNDYFALPEPAIKQNDFGGTFGGPVEIPGLYNGKDKTFFFVSYEGLRLTAPQAAMASFVPDLCMRGVVAQCPSGRAPAASALLPAINAFPLPSPNGLEDPANGFGQFIGSWSNPASLNSTSVRLDHIVNEKLRVFFRFNNTSSSSATRSVFNIDLAPPSVNNISDYALLTYTAGATSAFSSHLNNDFRLNYSSNEVTVSAVIDALGGNTAIDLPQLAGLGPGSLAAYFFSYGPYFIYLSQGPSSGAQRQWNVVDTMGLSLGRHQFKFGMDYRRLAPFAARPSPQASYGALSETDVETNSGFFFTQAVARVYPLYINFSAFAQDEWKVSRRLSLSLGLRWEVNPAPGVTRGLKPYTIEFQGSGPDTWALAPQGTALWLTTWYNFAPRLGAAYILHNAQGRETVLRGGGGAFYDTGQQLGSGGIAAPGFFANSAFCFACPFPGNPSASIPTIVNPPVPPYRPYLYGFSRRLQLPYTLQWNASIEQALGSSQSLTVSYLGSHASRLLRENRFQSSVNPVESTFFVIQNGLTSDYDSLQVQFRRRLKQGLTTLASYAWSHCIDYGSQNYVIGYRRGNCDFDVRDNLSAAFSYDLPNVGRNSFSNAVLHHWGLDDRLTARTAFPVDINGGTFFDRTTGQQMPTGVDLVPSQPIYLYGSNCTSVLQGLGNLQPGQGCPGGRAINPNAFTQPPTDPNTRSPTRPGTAPRNFVRGFVAWQMNVAVRRDFPIHEGLRLQFRAEAFNIFNHPNFGTIDPNFGEATFGQATATLANSLGVLNPLYQMGGPRSMQFALKLVF